MIFFYLGELDDEECHWTNKKVNGVLLIQCRHSGYIQVLPCNIESMTGKAAAKWCAQTWMGGWDVPSEVVTDSGKEYTKAWPATKGAVQCKKAKSTPPNGGENCVLALESTTSGVKSTRIERCLAKEPAALL